MSDMAQKNYIDQNIWPNLLYLYHTKKEPTVLRMVQGEFVQHSRSAQVEFDTPCHSEIQCPLYTQSGDKPNFSDANSFFAFNSYT